MLVRDGVLFAEQDLRWHFGQVHGHDRHLWIMDEIELGRGAAEAMHMENVWVSNGAASMIGYYDETLRVDVWLASPEGKRAMDEGRQRLREQLT